MTLSKVALVWRGVLLALLLAACADRGMITIAKNTPPDASIENIFVATTRQPAEGNLVFSSLRTSVLSFARFDISIPPSHQAGKIEWPEKPEKGADPATDFATRDIVRYKNARDFSTALRKNAQNARREAIVYVHGFNITFAEGTYRLAQLSHDLKSTSTAVHYSWPATQNTLEYTRDRDSVLFARDGLQSLLEILAAQPYDRIVIVAHSIGSNLVVETLRQIYLQRKTAVTRKLAGVVLISPDIDTNLFEMQLSRIKPLPEPFVIFGDEADLALKASAFLTGQSNRVGQLKDTEILRRYGVQFVNVTDINDSEDKLSHTVAITSPTVLSILQKLSMTGPLSYPEEGAVLQTLIDRAKR
ncbi:MAG: alpha/beta hydrolase [Rhodobacteraceae bacterium]|nr:alpha/beta hydrolase [Paracoccaceae bacterium]